MESIADIWPPLKTALGLLLLLGIYMPFGGIVPFLLGLRSVRVRRSDEIVRLTGLDVLPMLWSGFALCGACVLSVRWGWKAALLTLGGSVVLAFGFRLRVRVIPEGTRIIRSFAYVIPWSWRVYSEAPTVFVDGWGDFSDPKALYLGVQEANMSIELGWGDRWSGDRCEALAAAFNEAVREEITGGDGGVREANAVSGESWVQ